MPANCATCGNEEFDLLDGLYFCQLCQTLCENLKDEEFEIEDRDASIFSSRLKISKPKLDRKEKIKAKKDVGRPWQTHEGWTLVLKSQVDALLKIGADHRLNKVVLQLWMLYLSKCGIAFNKSSEKCHHLSIMRPRDHMAPSIDNPDVSQKMKLKQDWRKRNKVIASVIEENEKKRKEKLQQCLAGEEFYEGDNPFEDVAGSEICEEKAKKPPDIDVTKLPKEEKEGDVDAPKVPFEKKAYFKNAQYMTGNKTLAFCYIGMMYLHKLVSPADFLRWVDKGLVPFKHNIVSLFNSDMKLFCEEPESYRKSNQSFTMTATNLRKEVSILMNFLCVSGPKDVSLDIYCSKYIEELKLPGVFHQLVRTFLKRVPYKLRSMKIDANINLSHVQPYELLAVGCIIVLLKLLFGLNDVTEIKIKAYAENIKKLVNLDINLFVLDEWLMYMMNLNQEPHCKFLNFANESMYSMDCDTVLEDFKNYNDAQERVLQQRMSINPILINAPTRQQEFKDSVNDLLSSLMEKLEYKKNRNEDHFDDSSLSDPPEQSETASAFPSNNVNVECFKQCTLDYLLDEDFLEKNTSKDVSNASEIITSTQSNSQDNATASTSSFTGELEDLQERRKEIFTRRIYWYSDFKDSKFEQSSLYQQLLRICHKVTGCDIEEIHNYVRRVEYMYLPPSNLSGPSSIRNSFLLTHFQVDKTSLQSLNQNKTKVKK